MYQRWIYPIDKKRTNEFGTSGESPDHPVEDGTTTGATSTELVEQNSSNASHPKSE